jgi:hypothetical protein
MESKCRSVKRFQRLRLSIMFGLHRISVYLRLESDSLTVFENLGFILKKPLMH